MSKAALIDRERLSFGEGEIMRDIRMGNGAAFLPGAALLGAAIGAAAALLMAPSSGDRTRRTIVRKGEEVAERLIGEVKGVVEKCEGHLRAQREAGVLTELHR
jgi:gas vesicle protein